MKEKLVESYEETITELAKILPIKILEVFIDT
jgi:hypothetical protein